MNYRHNGTALSYRWSRLARISLLACSILTAACQGSGDSKPETTANNAASVGAGETTTSAGSSQTANHTPVISGASSQTVNAGSAYQFVPQASDADGDTLAFSITNKPTWATFSTADGRLSGTPSTSHAGNYANIVISVSDGTASSAVAFSLQVVTSGQTSATPTTNVAPAISGTATTAVNAGQAYSFTPTATDANGDTLTFAIQNKPSWASFNTATGRLSGTPSTAQVSTYSGIVISVSDGTTNVALAAFTITVAAVSNGSAALSWTPPTQNEDGSALTNLAGYKIYYGTSESELNQTITINSAGIAQYVVENLSPATWYFAIKSVNASGVESDYSATVSKQI